MSKADVQAVFKGNTLRFAVGMRRAKIALLRVRVDMWFSDNENSLFWEV